MLLPLKQLISKEINLNNENVETFHSMIKLPGWFRNLYTGSIKYTVARRRLNSKFRNFCDDIYYASINDT